MVAELGRWALTEATRQMAQWRRQGVQVPQVAVNLSTRNFQEEGLVALVAGLLAANVSRDIGFHFLRLGTAIEQADMTTRIIDAGASGLVTPRSEDDREAYQNMQWMAVLRALAAYQMYRRHVRQRVSGTHALRFLLHNGEFPRSVQFCLTRIQRIVPALPPRPAVDRAVSRAVGLVRQADPDALAAADPSRFMDEVQVYMGRLHEAVAAGYFSD